MSSRLLRVSFSSGLGVLLGGSLFTDLEKTPRLYAKDIYESCALIKTTLDPKHHLTCERMRERYDNAVLFSGTSNPELAEETAWELGKELGKATIGRYADGEVEVKLDTSVRGKDVYILQSASPPINETLLESLLIVSAARRASARSVTLVAPSLPYQRSTGSNLSSHMEEGGGVFLDARQPPSEGAEEESSRSLPSATLQAMLRAASHTARPPGDGRGGGSGMDAELRAMTLSASAAATASRILSQAATQSLSSSTRPLAAVDSKSLSSADVARMLVASGVDRVIGVELGPPGLGQSEGFYPSSVPVESLRATRISANHLAKLKLNKPVVVSPNEETITLAVDMRTILQSALPGSEVGLACITGELGAGVQAHPLLCAQPSHSLPPSPPLSRFFVLHTRAHKHTQRLLPTGKLSCSSLGT
jgi:phosphoribosylpyrophosphate synthetase